MQKPNDDEVVVAVWPRYVRWRKVDELAGNVKKTRTNYTKASAIIQRLLACPRNNSKPHTSIRLCFCTIFTRLSG